MAGLILQGIFMANDKIGRIPPHNADAENALLGAVLLRNRALEDVQNIITKDDFYIRANQFIWEGISNLRDEKPSVTIDLVTLTNYLSEKGTINECGGVPYIASLTNSVPSSTNASYYAQIIKNCALKRQLLDLSIKIGDSAFDDTQDVKKSIDDLDQNLSVLTQNAATDAYKSSKNLIYQVVEDVHAKMAGEKSAGLSSGFKTLDKYIGGFKPADYVIIGARPSVGKTAFALSIAHNMAFGGSNPTKVGFFSLEMSGESLMERIMARESSINSRAFRNGELSKEQDDLMMAAAARMYDNASNLFIQDTPNIRLMEMKSQARRMVRDEGVQIIFVDYIGLIELDGAGNKPRHEQFSEISRSLKSLARELNIPIVCLSQVNRDAAKDRPPMLSDLRESGSIEQDADLVILLDDASKRLDENNKIAQYDTEDIPEANNNDPDDKSNREIKIIIAKQRNGSTGAFNMLFRAKFVSFNEIERRPSF